MPSSPGYKRDYKQERATAKARGETDDNAARKQARRDMEKAGKVKPFDNKDVDHVKMSTTSRCWPKAAPRVQVTCA
jgi:hypothetical protein